MPNIKSAILFFAGFTAIVISGCENKKPQVEIESSADLCSYAAVYPEALSSEMTRYTEDAVKAREKMDSFSSFPGGLDNPDWAVVAEVYESADAEGRGWGFASRMDEARMAGAFFDREKEEITRRVNGAVKSAIEKDEECKCEVDTYGKVSYSLKEAVERRLDEGVLEASQAHAVIERNEKELGKKNVDALEKQAAHIAIAAYVVFVEMPTIYADVERRLGEVKDVRETLDNEIAAEKTRLSDKDTPKSEKKKIEERIKELENSNSAISIFEGEAKQLVSKAETDIPAGRKKYEDAFKKLMDDVDNRGKNKPAASPSK